MLALGPPSFAPARPALWQAEPIAVSRPPEANGTRPATKISGEAGKNAPGPDGLTEAERAQVSELASRDREVRAHEQAHAAVGGQYAGSPSYEYAAGPDDRRYAVAGEVPIDTAPVPGDPEETIAKMRVVAAAALAPAKPSAQDRAVAALARSQQMQAQAELFAQRREEAGLPAGGVSRRA
jgi:hypothetical protein